MPISPTLMEGAGGLAEAVGFQPTEGDVAGKLDPLARLGIGCLKALDHTSKDYRDTPLAVAGGVFFCGTPNLALARFR